MNKNELPLGFAFALAQNQSAMERFTGMPKEQKNAFVQKAHAISSKDEMQSLVSSLSASE